MKNRLLKIHLKFSIYIIVGFLSINACVAQRNAEMEEFLQEFFRSETVFAQDRKEIQFTLIPQFTRTDNNHLTIPLSVEYGITNRLQVEIEVPYLISSISKQQTLRGVGNTEVGLLYNVIRNNRIVSLSVGVEKSLQTTGEKLRPYNDEPSWEAFTVIARQFGILQMHSNIAAEFSDDEASFHYGIATVFSIGRCRPTFELNSQKEEERIFYFTPGLLLSLPSGIEFGVSVSGTVSSEPPFQAVTALLTYEF